MNHIESFRLVSVATAAEVYNQATAMLRDAVAKGFKDAAHMKKDADLDPLRQREDFKKLLAELEGKTGKLEPKK